MITYNKDNSNHFKNYKTQKMMPPQPPQGNDLKLDGLTRDEIKKIQKSMKKPQFMGLLNQYMIQISDPKNKAEYDEYLKQMQKQGQLPKHLKLVKLKPQFCFRTQIVSSRNKKHQMKFFVNMCSSEYIEKPMCQPAKDERGGVGYNWKVPNSLGKIRYDQDKHKNPCQVIDCAFHPDTFIFCYQNSAFQAMIISIALEGAQKQLGQRKQTLSRDYIILKNLKCKAQNGEPALLPIRYIDGKAYNRGEGPTQQQRNLQGKQTKLQKQINKQKQDFQSTKKDDKQQKPQQKQKQKQEQVEEDLDDNKQKKKLVQDLQKGIQAPKFTSIYTYVTDYSDYIDGPAVRKARTLPSVFTVQFKVPRMENISQATTLQINQKKIILVVHEKYYIDLSFEDMKVKNYPLKHTEAKAKFDKKKKTLRIQIPVDIASIPDNELPQYKEQEQTKEVQNDKIVENQTWKAKVLQIPEQTENQKFLSQAAAEESKKEVKKLIQEIDQDDVIEEREGKVVQKDEQQIKQKQQVQEEQFVKPFSVSSYYTLITQQNPTTVSPIPLIFKQSQTHIFQTFYLRNYNKQHTKVHFDQRTGQLIIVWKQKVCNVVHTKLQTQFVGRIKRAELYMRVGYIAVVLEKKQKGDNWGMQCVRNYTQGEIKDRGYYENLIIQKQEQLKVRRQKQQQIQQQTRQKIKQQQQRQQKQSQTKPKAQQQQQKASQIIDDSIAKPQNNTQKVNKIDHQAQQQSLQQNIAFQKLPIQFIKFNVEFIQALN